MTAARGATLRHPPTHPSDDAVQCPRCNRWIVIENRATQQARCERCHRAISVERATLYAVSAQRLDGQRLQVLELLLGQADQQSGTVKLYADTTRPVALTPGDDLALVAIGRPFVALHNLSRGRVTPLVPPRWRMTDHMAGWLLPFTGALVAPIGLLIGQTLGYGTDTIGLLVIALLVLGLWCAQRIVRRYRRRRTGWVVPLGYGVAILAGLVIALPLLLSATPLLVAGVGLCIGGFFGRRGGR